MSTTVRITLHPMGKTIEVPRGTPLQDVLFPYGIEFPCGGRARCKGCRVRVIEGSLPITPPQEHMLLPEELGAGWRLSCQCAADRDLILELAQWEAAILSDDAPFVFVPRRGLGVAIDIGTTTVVAQLIDLTQGRVLAVRSALNAQARHGADIMTRVGFAVADDGQAILTRLIRNQTGKLIAELCEAAEVSQDLLVEIVLVGNTVMHHLFAGHSLEPLSHTPFESPHLGSFSAEAAEIGWTLPARTTVRFLPCIGGFVGSDILAGIYATGLHDAAALTALIDLGTNGEMVLGTRDRLLCASTAAGPAFEGARIHMGMRAATGAIHEVHLSANEVVCHVIGNVTARGLCGSGLVDAAAAFLATGEILPSGRLRGGAGKLPLTPTVHLSQTDVRELQLAKGAIAAGIRLLLTELHAANDQVRVVHLAGAFGNYVSGESARRIGLFDFALEQIHPAGNTALRGAKMALFVPAEVFERLAGSVTHVGLSELPGFQDVYVEEMLFPPHNGGTP